MSPRTLLNPFDTLACTGNVFPRTDMNVPLCVIDPGPMMLQVQSDYDQIFSTDTQFLLPAIGGPYSIHFNGSLIVSGQSGPYTIEFGSVGLHTFNISSDDGTPFQPVKFLGGGDRFKLRGILQWGDYIIWSTMERSWEGASLVTTLPHSGLPLVSPGTNSFHRTFRFLKDSDGILSLDGLETENWTSQTLTFDSMTSGADTIDIIGIENFDYTVLDTLSTYLTNTRLATPRYNLMLQTMDSDGLSNQTLGGGNSVATGAGLTAITSLLGKGWTINDLTP